MKETLTNFKLREFLVQDTQLVEEYADILRLLEPIPTYKNLIDLTLEQVETIKRYIHISDALPEIFGYVEGINEDELMDMKIVTFYSLFNSILKQLEGILAAEQEFLVPSNSDIKWEAVDGSERLSVMGILPMVDNLAGGDILKHKAIKQLPYREVFDKLRLDTLKSDIQHDMQKLKLKTD